MYNSNILWFFVHFPFTTTYAFTLFSRIFYLNFAKCSHIFPIRRSIWISFYSSLILAHTQLLPLKKKSWNIYPDFECRFFERLFDNFIRGHINVTNVFQRFQSAIVHMQYRHKYDALVDLQHFRNNKYNVNYKPLWFDWCARRTSSVLCIHTYDDEKEEAQKNTEGNSALNSFAYATTQ